MIANVSFSHLETPQISRHPWQRLFHSGCFLIFISILLTIFIPSCTSAQPSDPTSIVQTAYDRLNAGDVDGFMKLVSDDAVVIDVDGGRFVGSQAIRKLFEGMVTSHFRVEVSDVSAEGNVVTFTATVYKGDQLFGTYYDSVDVVANDQIIFDGSKQSLEEECKSNPAQAFCPET